VGLERIQIWIFSRKFQGLLYSIADHCSILGLEIPAQNNGTLHVCTSVPSGPVKSQYEPRSGNANANDFGQVSPAN